MQKCSVQMLDRTALLAEPELQTETRLESYMQVPRKIWKQNVVILLTFSL